MLKKHTKHTGHAQLQLDYHYKAADFKKSKGEKNSFEKSQDSRRVLVYLDKGLPDSNDRPGSIVASSLITIQLLTCTYMANNNK